MARDLIRLPANGKATMNRCLVLLMVIIFYSLSNACVFAEETRDIVRSTDMPGISGTKIGKSKNQGNMMMGHVRAAPALQVSGNIGLFFEDFETGGNGWKVTDGVWEIGDPILGPSSPHSGSNCAGTNLDGLYPDNARARLISPAISLPSLSRETDRIRMYFAYWYRMEEDYDFGYIQISTDDGENWLTLESLTGLNDGWYDASIDLTPYAGDEINIAFYLTSDGSTTHSGWYIDDVLVEHLGSIATNYLEIAIAFNGQFTMGMPNSSILLYDHPNPWSSTTTFRIDGTDYWNAVFSRWGTIIAPPKTTGLSNSTTWDVGGVRFTQTLSIVEGSTTGNVDTGEIKYTVVNTDDIPHEVGVRVMLDTMLGRNDGASFRIAGIGEVTTEYEFLGNDIPMYWQAFDDLSSPTFQSQGTLVGGLTTMPDRFVTAGWARINDEAWDFEVIPGQDFDYYDVGYYDSAIGIYWFPVTLTPGESKEFITYYGLGGIDIDVQPPLVVGLTAPAKVISIAGAPSSGSFTLTAYLDNSSPGVTKTASGITTELELPEGLRLAAGETEVHNIRDLRINEGEQTAYKITTNDTGGSLTYSLTVTAANVATKTVNKDIYVFGVETFPHEDDVASIDSPIKAVFNIEMDRSSLNESTFIVSENDVPIPGRVDYDLGTGTVTFIPSSDLRFNSNCIATITKEAKSSDGVALPHDVIWHFSTSDAPAKLRYIRQIPDDFAFVGSDFDDRMKDDGAIYPQVKYLQVILAEDERHIYPVSTVNGKFGPATQAAVVEFQKKYFETGSGSVDEETKAKLDELLKRYIEETGSIRDRVEVIYETVDNFRQGKLTPAFLTGKKLQRDFPIELILAIASQETGLYKNFNNELIGDDTVGRGIMQITTSEYVGAGSGNDSDDATQCRENVGESGKVLDKQACYLYYSNTIQGIEANIMDGLHALGDKYYLARNCSGYRGGGIEITKEEMRWISTVQRYRKRHCHPVDDPEKYVQKVTDKLGKLKSLKVFPLLPNMNRYDNRDYKLDDFVRIFEDAWKNSEWINLCSPGKIRIHDSNGYVTGSLDNESLEDIPNSIYDDETQAIVVFFPSDSYHYEVIGTAKGMYGLNITSIKNGEAITFNTNDIAISVNELHQYTIDWDALSKGEDGVILRIDRENDGIIDDTIILGKALPATFALLQNYPNPFRAGTNIDYQLPTHCNVEIKIYNTAGSLIKVLISEEQMAGYHTVNWDGKNEMGESVASGVYFCSIKAGNFTATKKMVVRR